MADMGVAVDGSADWWPAADSLPVLPMFSPYQTQPAQYIEVFNRGTVPFDYRIAPAEPWVLVEPSGGRVDQQVRATVRVDWSREPKGTSRVPIRVSGPDGAELVVEAIVDNRKVSGTRPAGFVEANRSLSPRRPRPRVVTDHGWSTG
ncbi:hypothetical protein SAMN05421810_1047 [Amycolatopsis arida]|uniref:Uncharacterized protein n=1 Tax=Amycolatopsis arida TaxID=587909 RepID=A0A1I5UKH2_9PSEU|nr:hypothetical protein [Amycolatopsis arida]TDX90929.1 hypothetical protein CLV69_1066 [Amycolatopsis arida]SFP95783.1 hypothetical protein SAMN05421810_1047 [Amycolatopsis arida]